MQHWLECIVHGRMTKERGRRRRRARQVSGVVTGTNRGSGGGGEDIRAGMGVGRSTSRSVGEEGLSIR